MNYFRYDITAEQECEMILICTTCKKAQWIKGKSYKLDCPHCKSIRRYGFRCTKCKHTYMPTEFKPRICPDCHPELFTEDAVLRKNNNVSILGSTPISNSSAHKTLAQKIHESNVTHLSDKPQGTDFTRELYDEWWEKLDPDEHEKLCDLGEDPYDPWR